MGSQDNLATMGTTRSSLRIGGRSESQKDTKSQRPSSQRSAKDMPLPRDNEQKRSSQKDAVLPGPSSQRASSQKEDTNSQRPSSQRSLKQSSQEPIRRSQRIVPSSTQSSLASSTEKRESQGQSSQKSVKGQSQDLQGRDLVSRSIRRIIGQSGLMCCK